MLPRYNNVDRGGSIIPASFRVFCYFWKKLDLSTIGSSVMLTARGFLSRHDYFKTKLHRARPGASSASRKNPTTALSGCAHLLAKRSTVLLHCYYRWAVLNRPECSIQTGVHYSWRINASERLLIDSCLPQKIINFYSRFRDTVGCMYLLSRHVRPLIHCKYCRTRHI